MEEETEIQISGITYSVLYRNTAKGKNHFLNAFTTALWMILSWKLRISLVAWSLLIVKENFHENELPLSKLFFPQVAYLIVGNGFVLVSPSSSNPNSLIINGEHNQDSGLVSWILPVAMEHKQKYLSIKGLNPWPWLASLMLSSNQLLDTYHILCL